MNILGIGPMELVLIVVLALIVLGPEKLPEVMAQVGRAINELRTATTQLSDDFNRTLQTELNETRLVADEVKGAFYEARSTVDEAVTGTPAVEQPVALSVDTPMIPATPVGVGTNSTASEQRATHDDLLPPY
jgi:sec-independent protein translocase protein TatB